MIGDPTLEIAKLYNMLPAEAGNTSDGRTAATNATVRTVFVVGPDKKIKLMLSYPMSTGRNFDEVLRVVDSMQLTAKHKVATPVNWKHGDDVIILRLRLRRRSEAEISRRLESPAPLPAHREATKVTFCISQQKHRARQDHVGAQRRCAPACPEAKSGRVPFFLGASGISRRP